MGITSLHISPGAGLMVDRKSGSRACQECHNFPLTICLVFILYHAIFVGLERSLEDAMAENSRLSQHLSTDSVDGRRQQKVDTLSAEVRNIVHRCTTLQGGAANLQKFLT